MSSWKSVRTFLRVTCLACSNFAQNHLYNPYKAMSDHYLPQFTWQVDQKWKLDQVELGLNIAQNTPYASIETAPLCKSDNYSWRYIIFINGWYRKCCHECSLCVYLVIDIFFVCTFFLLYPCIKFYPWLNWLWIYGISKIWSLTREICSNKISPRQSRQINLGKQTSH